MSYADEFISKYKELENVIRKQFQIEDYNKSALKEIEKISQFKSLKEDLTYIREIRNFLQHKPELNGEYPIQPNPKIILKMDEILKYIENPPRIYDKCVKINKVFFASIHDKIYPVMIKMKENVFTHIPILENGIVKGVFSENTLFGALIEDELVYEKGQTTFENVLIKKYCEISNHVSETFMFVKKEMFLEEAKDLFSNAFKDNKRLSMLFITQNGKPTEKLLGIVTPWDILG